jgi:hypothetical protein
MGRKVPTHSNLLNARISHAPAPASLVVLGFRKSIWRACARRKFGFGNQDFLLCVIVIFFRFQGSHPSALLGFIGRRPSFFKLRNWTSWSLALFSGRDGLLLIYGVLRFPRFFVVMAVRRFRTSLVTLTLISQAWL